MSTPAGSLDSHSGGVRFQDEMNSDLSVFGLEILYLFALPLSFSTFNT